MRCSPRAMKSQESGTLARIITIPRRILSATSTPSSHGRLTGTGACSMRCFFRFFVFLASLMAGNADWSQAPDYKNVGRAPTADEIRAWDTAVGPAGKELPPGNGTAKEGAAIFAEKCVVCHGPGGQGSQMAPRLV